MLHISNYYIILYILLHAPLIYLPGQPLGSNLYRLAAKHAVE